MGVDRSDIALRLLSVGASLKVIAVLIGGGRGGDVGLTRRLRWLRAPIQAGGEIVGCGDCSC